MRVELATTRMAPLVPAPQGSVTSGRHQASPVDTSTRPALGAAQRPPREHANNCGRTADLSAAQTLAKVSSIERVRDCRRVPVGSAPGVSVHARVDGAHFGHLETCSSVWACPRCARRIMQGRGDEIGRAITEAHARGWMVAMITLTMRHGRRDPLKGLWDNLTGAWAAVRHNAASRRAYATSGAHGWIRNVEATHGDNGWHVHSHVLVFLPADTTGAQLNALATAWFDAWSKRLVGLGARAPIRNKGGLHFKALDLSTAADAVADYIAKGTFTAPEAVIVGEAVERKLARELAGQATKTGRGGNRTPFQVLADFQAFGLEDDLMLWRDWEQGSRRRRQIHWSQGLRDDLLDDEEKTDEELAEEDEGGELVAWITFADWRAIRDVPGRPAQLLDLVDAVPPEDVLYVLTLLFEDWGLGRPVEPDGVCPAPDRVGGPTVGPDRRSRSTVNGGLTHG
jgi:hypothetical protein